ncbi:hypothetical protein Ocin01_07362 [Orchesella cincta]|uniref:DUF243 domain-containing protein n=1 Tax=Orchesella cincta TaxID=48709 RepID=A0A1D2N1Z3_ORCCI|nr:hypothetical protein Ocin01_07362 [Orchesella cincta]
MVIFLSYTIRNHEDRAGICRFDRVDVRWSWRGNSRGGTEAESLWKQVLRGSFRGVTTGQYEEIAPAPNRSDPTAQAPQQVVFVRPPTYTYKHDVVVTGGGASGQKTVIYVLPSKNKNQVNLVDNTSNTVVTQKPTVYFLKKDHDHSKSQEEVGSQPASPHPGVTCRHQRTRQRYNYQPLGVGTTNANFVKAFWS